MLLPAEVMGDLIEEYTLRCEEGRLGAARWVAWQVLRSLPQFWQPALTASFLGITVPLVLLDWFWALIHSLVPLRAGLERAPFMLAINIAACLAGAFGITRGCRTGSVSAILAAALALAVSVGQVPALYCLLMLSAPLAARIPLRR